MRHTVAMEKSNDHGLSASLMAWLRRHFMIIVLMAGALLALPAYLDAMSLQFLDMEFLASLCGFSGWGVSGK